MFFYIISNSDIWLDSGKSLSIPISLIFSIKVEDYTDHQGHTQATVSSKNAVVTYNLKTESLNFVSLDGEYFEEKYSGYFYSSGFFNQ